MALVGCLVHALAQLLLHLLRRRLPSERRRTAALDSAASSAAAVSYYEGVVHHTRRKPVEHSFEYRVRYCLLHLDAPVPPACCQHQLETRLTADEARALTDCAGPVRLLLMPSSAGYEQNPLCVYYCYDAHQMLQCCIAEVTNTPWGDVVRFAFDPKGDSVPKPMHVSPLQDMESRWEMRASGVGLGGAEAGIRTRKSPRRGRAGDRNRKSPPPGDRKRKAPPRGGARDKTPPEDETPPSCPPRSCPLPSLSLTIRCLHPELGDFFSASLSARRVSPPADSVGWAAGLKRVAIP